jgi:TolA-binding protein
VAECVLTRRGAPEDEDMNIDLWNAVGAAATASAVAGLGSRWWFGRQLTALRRERDKVDANHQSTVRLVSQTRKQIDDLQRMVTEYRRRLSSLELDRRRANAKRSALEALQDASAGAAACMPEPARWADTQPM